MAGVMTFLVTALAFQLPVRPPSATRPRAVDMDELIEDLIDVRPSELPSRLDNRQVIRTVGQPAFFLRIAELSDATTSIERQDKLRKLAERLSATLEAAFEGGEKTVEDASKRLSEIVNAAADDDGEFYVPLSDEKRLGLSKAVAAANVDEPLLSALNSVAKTAKDDGLDGVVVILQTVLQMYAAQALVFDPEQIASDVGAETPEIHPDYVSALDCYSQVLEANPDSWDLLLTAAMANDVTKGALLNIVQAQIERVLAQQVNGSWKQRVLAEFLTELVKRIEACAPEDQQDTPDNLMRALIGDN